VFFETVKLRKEGYSQRMTFTSFEDRFWICLNENQKGRDGVMQFLNKLLPDGMPSLWAIGTNKVFLRDKAVRM